MNEKLLYRVSEVAVMLSISRSKTYELIRLRILPSVKVDGMVRVRGCDLREFIDSLSAVA